MAQFNSANGSFQKQATTIFEVPMIANKNGQVVSLENPFPVTQLGPQINTSSFNTSTSTDAFGRLRTSDSFTLFDSTLRFGDDPREWSYSNTAGTSVTNVVHQSSISMNIGTGSGDLVVRQTKKYFNYQPGKSLLFLNTGVMDTPKTNLRQRIGNFNSNNGIYFEANNTTQYIVLRSRAVGNTVVNNVVPQSQWNVDTLDGSNNASNPSGIELDPSKVQIHWADVEWLGAGSVRAGYVINGQFILCHAFHHANISNSSYMTTASLPIRYEIENTGVTASSSRLLHICNSVISEGGYTPTVQTRAVGTALDGLAMTQNAYKPLISIRLKQNREGAIVVPSEFEVYGLQNTPFSYQVIQNPTITGGSWVSLGEDSHVEYNVTATANTVGGDVLLQGMFIGGTAAQPVHIDLKGLNHSYQLRIDLNGTEEILCIAAKSTTNNDDALASIVWSEFN